MTQLNASLPRSTRPEHDLLLCCARTHLNTKTVETIRTLVQTKIKWNYLIQTASNHGLMPLLYYSLSKISSDKIPEEVLNSLKKRFYENLAHNLARSAELQRILALLAVSNIAAIPFKGPIMAVLVYKDLALRQFIDLDLLIHQRDAFRVKDLFLNSGYKRVDLFTISNDKRVSGIPLTYAQELVYLRSACEYCFTKQDNTVTVEPHWRLIPRKFGISLNQEHLWHRTQEISLEGTKVITFSAEDTLLIACLNGAKDRWNSLKIVCDVAELIHAYPTLNWVMLLQQTKEIGCKRILLIGLLLASDLLSAKLPDIVWQEIEADRTVPKLVSTVKQQIFEKSTQQPKEFGGNFSTWNLQIRERLQDKLWYCFNLVFGPNEGDAKFFPLPSVLSWLYPLIRPYRLLIRLFRSLIKKIK